MAVQNTSALQEALVNAKEMDEMIAAFADHGITVTAEQLEQAAKETLAEMGDELSDSDLDGVAGGYSKVLTAAANYVGRAALKGFNAFLNYVGGFIKG